MMRYLVVILTLLLVACGGGFGEAEQNPTSTAEVLQTTPMPVDAPSTPVLAAATATSTMVPSPTATSTLAPTNTPLPTATATMTPEPTVTLEPTATATTSSSSSQQQSSSPTPATTACAGAISWNNAASHVGKDVTVIGPVIKVTHAPASRGRPTFVNIGKNYPSRDRFTVVIWGDDRGKFQESPERLYSGKTICVSGRITTYQGLPQIEVSDPKQVVIADPSGISEPTYTPNGAKAFTATSTSPMTDPLANLAFTTESIQDVVHSVA